MEFIDWAEQDEPYWQSAESRRHQSRHAGNSIVPLAACIEGDPDHGDNFAEGIGPGTKVINRSNYGRGKTQGPLLPDSRVWSLAKHWRFDSSSRSNAARQTLLCQGSGDDRVTYYGAQDAV
ncbi:hypothetical protein [Mycobacterium sp. Marseille-P9652]|uniref:hypothetical protein n=1 Tax=Mycobacterium sp. Marseille-P9652 TaxID=2654950 RepID=UPI0018D1C353|nr:hypothetical protein [Mycobacterium sp. Marseille-P9652]